MTPFEEGIWIDSAPLNLLGMRLTATMTVLRRDDGGLLLYSPIAASPERRAAIEALGKVADLYVPNLYHHLWVGDWADAFPDAKVHAPAGLAKKREGLRIERVHGASLEAPLAAVVDELPIGGFRLEESVLIHRRTGTLLVADLVHNIGRPPQLWTKIYAGLMGFYGSVSLSRAIRWLGFTERRAARRSLDALLKLPFDNLIVGHGAPLREGAREALAAAYDWLQA